MSSRRRKRRQDGNSLVALMLAATPLGGACLVCAAIAFGLRLPPPSEEPEEARNNTRCIMVSAPDAPDIRPWERDLYTWVTLRNPTVLILPNERLGFSRVRARTLRVPIAPIPAYTFTEKPAREQPHVPIALRGDSLDFPEKIVLAWQPFPPPVVDPVPVEPLPHGIFWRRSDGQLVGDVPPLDEAAVRAAFAESSVPVAPTILLVSRPVEARAIRVRVLQSCGNTSLDLLAVNVIRKAVGELELRERQAGEEDPRPSYFPALGGTSRLEVEWDLAFPGSS